MSSWRSDHPRQAQSQFRVAKLRNVRKKLAIAALCVVALVTLLSLATAPAWAATGHDYLSALSEAPLGTKLSEPAAVAIDHADGKVFISDLGDGVIDIYDASDTYLTQLGEGSLFASGIAIDEASGDLYVADGFRNAVLVFKPSGGGYALLSEWSGEGLPGGEFDEITGIAVDNSKSASAGEVDVVDAEDPETGFGVVDVFKPKSKGAEEDQEGDLVRGVSAGKMDEPNGIAIDGVSGKVYVADAAKGGVYEFSATGVFEGKLTGASSPQGSFFGKEEETGNVSAVAIDPASGDLLVAEAERGVVSEFNGAGEWVGWITGTPSGSLG